MFTPNLFFVIPYRPQDGLQTLSKFLPPPSSPQLRVPAGPQQQRAPEVCALPNLNREFQRVIGHCRTSTTSARSQRALPDLNRGWLSLNTAGPQLRVPDLSGHRPNRELDLSGHCRTSTASFRSHWALPDFNSQR